MDGRTQWCGLRHPEQEKYEHEIALMPAAKTRGTTQKSKQGETPKSEANCRLPLTLQRISRGETRTGHATDCQIAKTKRKPRTSTREVSLRRKPKGKTQMRTSSEKNRRPTRPGGQRKSKSTEHSAGSTSVLEQMQNQFFHWNKQDYN
jgi:hypothetical protein